MKNYRANAGITLIELMITVAVIGILSSIAVPAYQDYVRRGRIPEATSTLAAQRARIEQHFQDNKTFVGFGLCTTADTATSQYFNFNCVAAPTAATYQLRAEGKGAMAGFVYTVDQDNSKASTVTGVSGWTGNSSCWVTSKGGKC